MPAQPKSFIKTCRAPVNIAVIKYWGKRDEKLIIPVNDSISLTLSTDDLCATTSIVASGSFDKTRLWLNGVEESAETERIKNCLRETKKRRSALGDSVSAPPAEWNLYIASRNNFPTAAGLASSAAGYACLVSALQNLYGIDGNLSSVARQGSGSACRSMFGGFVQWKAGTAIDGSDSVAVQIKDESHWPEIRCIVCVANDQKKATGSTDGMQRSIKSSTLMQHRIKEVVPSRIESMLDAIKRRDFNAFAEITMKDSNQFHAVCQDTYPPIRYMNSTSWQVVQMVHAYNEARGSNVLAYTFDAGPNAFLFTLEKDVSEVLRLILNVFAPAVKESEFIRGMNVPVAPTSQFVTAAQNNIGQTEQNSLKYIICTKIGSGPTVCQDHLIKEDGSLL